MFSIYTRQRWGNFIACCMRFVFRRSPEVLAVWAVKRGNLPALQKAVTDKGLDVRQPLTPNPQAYSSSLRACEKKGTLLHQAAARGDLDTVMWLVDQGAEVECFTSWGRSPIMYAAEAGHAHVVAWLASRGADPNRPRPSQSTFVEDFVGPSSVRLLSYHDIEFTGQEHLPFIAAKLDQSLPAASAVAARPRF